MGSTNSSRPAPLGEVGSPGLGDPPQQTPTDTTTDIDAVIAVTAWVDPIVDTNGHHPRSLYVEECYLPICGPTASWLYRKLTDRLDDHPGGYAIDLADLARQMGLSYRPNRPSSPFGRAIGRLKMFDLAHPTTTGLAVRRRLPQLPARQLRRLPADVQRRHNTLIAAHITLDAFNRAHSIATAMHDAGDTPDRIEHQLTVLGVDTTVAEAAAATFTQLTQETH